MSSNPNDVKKTIESDQKVKHQSLFSLSNLNKYSFSNFNKDALLQNPYVEAVLRVGSTIFTISTIMHPLDKAMAVFLRHGNLASVAKVFTKSPITIYEGFFTTAKQAGMKNMVIANKGTVGNKVSDVTGENENPALKRQRDLIITIFLLSLVDTASSNYLANLRTAKFTNLDIKLNTLADKFKFAQAGGVVRFGRNVLITAACTGSSTIMSDFFNPFIPKDTYGFAHTAATSIFSGFAIAPFSTIFDNIYQEKIRLINTTTLKTPTLPEVLRSLWKEGGTKRFARGGLIGGFYSTAAFLGINGINEVLDKHVFNQPARLKQHNAFFAPAPQKQLGAGTTPEAIQANGPENSEDTASVKTNTPK